MGTKIRISERQRGVIIGLASGLTAREVARRMNLSTRTIQRDILYAKNALGIGPNRFTVGHLVIRAVAADLEISGYKLSESGRIVSTVSHAVRG